MAREVQGTSREVVTRSAGSARRAEVRTVESVSTSMADLRVITAMLVSLAACVDTGNQPTGPVDAVGGDTAIARAESGESEDLEVMVDTNQVVVMNISEKVVTVLIEHLNDEKKAIKGTTVTLKPGNNVRMSINGSAGDVVRVTDSDGKTSQYPVILTSEIPNPPINP